MKLVHTACKIIDLALQLNEAVVQFLGALRQPALANGQLDKTRVMLCFCVLATLSYTDTMAATSSLLAASLDMEYEPDAPAP